MSQIAPAAHWEFLWELDAWIARGRPAREFAAREKVAPGTITYRLNRYGLRAERAMGLVDKRTGERFSELVKRGAIRLAEPIVPAGVPA